MAAVKKGQTEDKAVVASKAEAGPAPEQTGPTVAVTIVGPSHITHHGQLYRAGDTVHLPQAIAKTLVESGAVTKA